MGSLHARVVSESDRAKIAFISDPDIERATRLADRHGGAPLAEPDFEGCDAVIVASPTESHAEWGQIVLDLGIPMLLEKPMALRYRDAKGLVEKARANDVPLTCGLVERFNPAIKKAIEIADSPLQLIALRHSPYVPRIKTGVAADLAIHDVDIAMRVFGGPPDTVRGSTAFVHPESAGGAEDVASIVMTFAGGGIASLSTSRITHRKRREIIICELDRSIEIDLIRQDITIYRHVENETLDESEMGLIGYRQQTIMDVPVVENRREPLAAQLDHFCALVDGTADRDRELDEILAPHLVLDQLLNGEG